MSTFMTLLSLLCLSGQFIPGWIQQVCSLLKPQITSKEFHFGPKPFFRLFAWQELPYIFFCRQIIATTPFIIFFSLFFVLWREKSLPHHQLKLSSCTFVSVTDMETMTKTPKTKKLPGVYPLYKELEQQDTVWDAFCQICFCFFKKKHYRTWKETDCCCSYDILHTTKSFLSLKISRLPVYPLSCQT